MTVRITLSYNRCEVVSILSTTLLVFNSSINIIIYCWSNKSFREVILTKLRIVYDGVAAER